MAALAGVGATSSRAASLASPAREVHVWEKEELTFTSDRTFSNPSTNAAVWVDLTGPGFGKHACGFRDEGNTFRIPIAATTPGTWRWESGSKPSGSGLASNSGSFVATECTEEEMHENQLRRGFPWHIKMKDGTVVRSARLRWGTGSAADVKNEGGMPFFFPGKVPGYEDVFPDINRINPEYFKCADRKVDYLNSQGFVPFIEVMRRDASECWKKYYSWPEPYSRHIEYVWSRYQANNIVFSPIHLDTLHDRISTRDYVEAIDLGGCSVKSKVSGKIHLPDFSSDIDWRLKPVYQGPSAARKTT